MDDTDETVALDVKKTSSLCVNHNTGFWGRLLLLFASEVFLVCFYNHRDKLAWKKYAEII